MNKYQRLVIIVALINALIMVLFPPFNSQPLAKGMLPSFDGFYPLISHIGSKQIHKELLTLQLMFLSINTLIAWLVLQTKKHQDDIPAFSFMQGIVWFLVLNLALIFIFPPFEPYQSMLRSDGSSFDSFYFAFGDRSRRPLFVPLLYLECLLVVINALTFLLLFNAVKRSDDVTRQRIIQMTENLPDETLLEIGAAIQHKVEQHQIHQQSHALGRGTDRRHKSVPFAGADRRHGDERRNE